VLSPGRLFRTKQSNEVGTPAIRGQQGNGPEEPLRYAEAALQGAARSQRKSSLPEEAAKRCLLRAGRGPSYVVFPGHCWAAVCVGHCCLHANRRTICEYRARHCDVRSVEKNRKETPERNHSGSMRDLECRGAPVELWFLTGWSRKPHDGDCFGGLGGRHVVADRHRPSESSRGSPAAECPPGRALSFS
jgi:hypothetical protein